MLLTNGTILSLSPASVERVDLHIVDGSVVARGRNLRPKRGEERIDLSGKLVMPGLVNAHTHLYSSLARGMPPPRPSPKNFLEILKKVWWKLDEALDEDSIYYSALVGSLEAAKYGATTLIDHHASPNHIPGSLDIIKKAMKVVGLRGILCYETTDRGGPKRRDAGLVENERFVTENINNERFRGTIGAHALFTLNDDTLQALGELSGMYDCGVHLHIAEDKHDVKDAMGRMRLARHPDRTRASDVSDPKGNRRMRYASIVQRLDDFSVLSPKSILAHGIHLSHKELSAIEKSGAWLVHNPRSNMNNAVGYAPLNWFGLNAAIGTDGFPADMFEECRVGFLRNQESGHRVGFARLPEMLQAGQRLLVSFFGKEFGRLGVGSPADLIVLNYNSPTPFTASNLVGHLLFGMNSGMVAHTMVNGRWIVFNGQFVGIDEDRVMSEAGRVAGLLWKRMNR